MIKGSPLSRVNTMLSNQRRSFKDGGRVKKYQGGGPVGKYGGQMHGLGDWAS